MEHYVHGISHTHSLWENTNPTRLNRQSDVTLLGLLACSTAAGLKSFKKRLLYYYTHYLILVLLLLLHAPNQIQNCLSILTALFSHHRNTHAPAPPCQLLLSAPCCCCCCCSYSCYLYRRPSFSSTSFQIRLFLSHHRVHRDPYFNCLVHYDYRIKEYIVVIPLALHCNCTVQ